MNPDPIAANKEPIVSVGIVVEPSVAFVLNGDFLAPDGVARSGAQTVTADADATYTATFAADAPTQYTVTVLSANSSMGTVSGGGTYNAGATATIRAIPNDGYHFTQWNDGNTSATRTFTVTGDVTYIASFEENPPTQYTVTVISNNPAWGSVTGGGTYNEGETVTITAVANNGYHFQKWQDDIVANPRTITVTGNATYVAYFQADANDGVNTVADNAQVVLYPNPAHDAVTLSGVEAGATLRLIDVSGREILARTAAADRVTVDISSLAPGVYYIRVSSSLGTSTHKLVKH